MSSSGDFQLAAAAAGFTLGFGVLTVWKAYRQTKRNKSPLRSAYVYMIWGEILANLIIGILGYLFLHGTLQATYVLTSKFSQSFNLTAIAGRWSSSLSFSVMFLRFNYYYKSS